MLTVVRRVAKAMATVTSQREAFEAYCKERYGGFSDESVGTCPKSKTITASKGEMIVTVWDHTALESAARPMECFLQKVHHSIEWHAF